MKMRKASLVVLATVVLFVMLTGVAFAEKVYHWKIGHIRPTGTEIDRDVNWLVEKIKEESKGRITIEVYPAS